MTSIVAPNGGAGPLPPKQVLLSDSHPHPEPQPMVQKVMIASSGGLPGSSLIDDQYRCCCSHFHVERGAYWIAMLGITMCALSLFPTVWFYSYSTVFTIITSLVIYVCILVAQRRQQPMLYLPYLVVNAIGLVMIPIYIGILVVLMVYMPEVWETIKKNVKPDDYKGYTDEDLILGARWVMAAFIVLFVLSEALGIWFQSVVYRAYKYMKLSSAAKLEIQYA